jgi:hypothetical protein
MTKRRPKIRMLPGLPIGERHWLLTGQYNGWYFLTLRVESRARPFWKQHEDFVVSHWALRHPGTRPKLWWQFSAPEPRLRLGGTGDSLDTCSAYVPRFKYGIPADWRTADQHYLHSGVPIDPSDPPRFESVASYLQRLGLFLPGEQRRVARHCFKPLVIVIGDDRVTLRLAAHVLSQNPIKVPIVP